MEWLEDVTAQQQQGLQALAPDADGCSTAELLLLQQLQDNQIVPIGGQAPSMFDQQPITQQQQQQATDLENGSSSDDWLQELPQQLNAAAAAAAATAAWIQAPDSRRGNSSYDEALQTSSLQGVGFEPAHAAAVAERDVMQQVPTVAPDGDLLYLFRRIFAMPPFPGGTHPFPASFQNSCNYLQAYITLWYWCCQQCLN
jgi:hypothetical protein